MRPVAPLPEQSTVTWLKSGNSNNPLSSIHRLPSVGISQFVRQIQTKRRPSAFYRLASYSSATRKKAIASSAKEGAFP
jgi:hypothetical protein